MSKGKPQYGNVVFKICRKSDGLYSTGGYHPSFNKTGKTWSTASTLNSHLSMVEEVGKYTKKDEIAENYSDCEIVQFFRSTVTIPVLEHQKQRKETA
jgi:hypothetical protein